ncbi:hypothetical protein COCOBI_pt-0230 (chloroplast) [Coccomyxa sp. Obi]|nr:hypothetical protein COCOBI_pt-0230 [Coccomyxa sp. Obi]
MGFVGMGVRWPPPAIEGAGAWGSMAVHPLHPFRGAWDARGGRSPPPTTTRLIGLGVVTLHGLEERPLPHPLDERGLWGPFSIPTNSFSELGVRSPTPESVQRLGEVPSPTAEPLGGLGSLCEAKAPTAEHL